MEICMKFTNGFWLVRDEYTPDYVRDFYTVEEDEDSVRAYAPYKKIDGRGDMLNIGVMTFSFTAPAEDVLGVKMQNHMGNYDHSPSYILGGMQGRKALVREVKNAEGGKEISSWEISSGKVSVRFSQGSPEMNYFAEGKPLTCTKSRSMGMMHEKSGKNYILTGLNLGVGELVYGLGERFTPMVKNGQVVDMWNEDGGTASEIAYKNIPFYYTSAGYGVFVNHPGAVSFEIGSEKVETVQFSVEDEELARRLEEKRAADEQKVLARDEAVSARFNA